MTSTAVTTGYRGREEYLGAENYFAAARHLRANCRMSSVFELAQLRQSG